MTNYEEYNHWEERKGIETNEPYDNDIAEQASINWDMKGEFYEAGKLKDGYQVATNWNMMPTEEQGIVLPTLAQLLEDLFNAIMEMRVGDTLLLNGNALLVCQPDEQTILYLASTDSPGNTGPISWFPYSDFTKEEIEGYYAKIKQGIPS